MYKRGDIVIVKTRMVNGEGNQKIEYLKCKILGPEDSEGCEYNKPNKGWELVEWFDDGSKFWTSYNSISLKKDNKLVG